MADRELVLLTIQEYATQMRLSVSTIRRQIKAGELPIIRPSPRSIRIKLSRVVRSGH